MSSPWEDARRAFDDEQRARDAKLEKLRQNGRALRREIDERVNEFVGVVKAHGKWPREGRTESEFISVYLPDVSSRVDLFMDSEGGWWMGRRPGYEEAGYTFISQTEDAYLHENERSSIITHVMQALVKWLHEHRLPMPK